jgi:tetratricopeptide (TPR) repeat protein
LKKTLVFIVAILGLACTLLSVFAPWFTIPVGTEISAATGKETLQIAQPWITPLYRGIALFGFIAMVILWFIGRHRAYMALAAASVWFVAILFYPYCTMVWDPYIAGNAAWLEAQHMNLVWSGGDVSTSLEYRIVGALDELAMVDAPSTVNPTMMSDWQLSELNLARLPELVDRLGYSDKFFEFIRFGWIAALGGSVLLIIWMCAADGHIDINRGLWTLGALACIFLPACLFTWGWSMYAAGKLASAAEYTAKGQFAAAIGDLNRAAKIMPALREDTYFITQKGLLENALGRDTPEARLYHAGILERCSLYQQAEATYEQLLAELPARSPVRREACRAILRTTVNDMNAGRANAAARELEYVLAAEPCNLKANYTLQIAYLRCKRYSEIPRLVQRMDDIYNFFQYPNKYAVQYAAHCTAEAADYRRGDPNAAIMQIREIMKQ